MPRKFQIRHIIFAAATFGLGVLAASLFSSSTAPLAIEPTPVVIRSVTEKCERTGQFRYHGDRERLVEDRIRETEKELVDLMARPQFDSLQAERRVLARILHLRTRLDRLLLERDALLREKVALSKLVYREVCYEK